MFAMAGHKWNSKIKPVFNKMCEKKTAFNTYINNLPQSCINWQQFLSPILVIHKMKLKSGNLVWINCSVNPRSLFFKQFTKNCAHKYKTFLNCFGFSCSPT